MAGSLYVVSTPIGNLEDMTIRAVEVLKNVGRIACEDTRQTRKLLDRYGIPTPMVSYHEHNEPERSLELIGRLKSGESIALVSDAPGTPLISDPGYRLVAAAREVGIQVIPIPGASAVMAALSASGLATDAFYFGGFLPARSGQRRSVLEELKDHCATLIFFETPHRIVSTLADIAAVMGERRVVIARELTKMHEEFLAGTPEVVARILRERGEVKGEITLIIEKGAGPNPAEHSDEEVRHEVERCLQGGLSRMEAIKTVARRLALPKRAVYRIVEGAAETPRR